VVSHVKPVSLSMNVNKLLVVEKQQLTRVYFTGDKERKRYKLPVNLEAEHALETASAVFIVCGQLVEKSGNKIPSIMEVLLRFLY